MNITYVLKDVFFALKYAYVTIKYFGMFLFGVLALLKVPHNPKIWSWCMKSA